jgi:cytochrome c oxidase assembly protein subunit 15
LPISPAWRSFFENALTIQFDHRMVAYTIFLLVIAHAFDAWRSGKEVRGAFVLAGAVTVQVALGIVTLLNKAPLPLALAHQLAAILVFTVAVVHAERLWHRTDMLAPKPAALRARS